MGEERGEVCSSLRTLVRCAFSYGSIAQARIGACSLWAELADGRDCSRADGNKHDKGTGAVALQGLHEDLCPVAVGAADFALPAELDERVSLDSMEPRLETCGHVVLIDAYAGLPGGSRVRFVEVRLQLVNEARVLVGNDPLERLVGPDVDSVLENEVIEPGLSPGECRDQSAAVSELKRLVVVWVACRDRGRRCRHGRCGRLRRRARRGRRSRCRLRIVVRIFPASGEETEGDDPDGRDDELVEHVGHSLKVLIAHPMRSRIVKIPKNPSRMYHVALQLKSRSTWSMMMAPISASTASSATEIMRRSTRCRAAVRGPSVRGQ